MERVFEWDDRKDAANLVKHGLTFAFAARVFQDPMLVELDVFRPNDREARWKAVGRLEGRMVTVVFTMRGPATRMISARRGNAPEERAYEAFRSGSR
jgi:uncharacterized protein